MAGRIAIICAMPQEIKPLVRQWRKVRERGLTFFESEKAIAVAAGIGAAPAALATMTLVAREQPSCLISAGIAGALRQELKVGDLFWPRTVINVATGKRFASSYADASGTVVSGRVIADAEHKRALREEFAADLIDMEGAGIASIAESCGLPFYVVKTVSDEVNFPMPPMNEFVDTEGKFHTVAFAVKALVHPQWWGPILALAQNSAKAAAVLCRALEHQIEQLANSKSGAFAPQR
jgi:nucleoside phosphorylase